MIGQTRNATRNARWVQPALRSKMSWSHLPKLYCYKLVSVILTRWRVFSLVFAFLFGLSIAMCNLYEICIIVDYTPCVITDDPSVGQLKNKSRYKVNIMTTIEVERDMPSHQVKHVDCSALFRGDADEVTRANKISNIKNQSLYNRGKCWTFLTENCSAFRKRHGYMDAPVNQEEGEFPLAFSILFYKDVAQVEQLLRAIYRPQNVYCLHADRSTWSENIRAVNDITRCLPNVFMASKSIKVSWGTTSVIEPEIICMKDLLHKNKSWRYFINLTGQEYPLKTNLDIVRILKTFNGTNDVRGNLFKNEVLDIQRRVKFKHKGLRRTFTVKDGFKYDITMVKGSVHIIVSRKFAEFATSNKMAVAFYRWIEDTGHASETFFNSLQYSPQLGVPGAYTDDPGDHRSVTRWKRWMNDGYECQGKYRRGICIVGVGDLASLYNSTALFVNKLHWDYQPLAAECLHELHWNRTWADLQGRQTDLTPYRDLTFVKEWAKVKHALEWHNKQ